MRKVDCHDLYRDGRHYDLINRDITDDIPFFVEQARKYGSPVLELGAGTGRITIPIAEAGIKIVGLDLSFSMLTHAKRKADIKGVYINWIHGDCRNFSLGVKFNLIIFPFNALTHIHGTESIEGLLSCVKEHLTDDGSFIIDVFNPRHDILMRDPLSRYIIDEYPDPDGRGTIVIWESNYYDTAEQMNRLIWYFYLDDKELYQAEYNMRIYYPLELDALLRYNGFNIEAKYGNYNCAAFNSKSRKQIVVCKKKILNNI
jgi:SAM-dependent methyltransferase